MAVLRRMAHNQIRHPNKEPEWSSICDNVLDQYLNDDDVFGLGIGQHQRSDSDESAHLFDFSISSGQSNQTTGTSPDLAWAHGPGQPMAAQAQQPQAKEGSGFWQRTLKALERNAAESEEKQRKLRVSKSHPDFLSLGGYPSPAAIPCPVPDHSLSVPRSRARESANGKKRSTSQVRSISRGRPSGVAKNTTNTCATVRKASVSPHKMMNPSRYRAGFREVWADKLEASPNKYALKVSNHPLPESPPPSAQLHQHDFAAFGSPTHASFPSQYDAELSPLTSTFQQARIHTPEPSPFYMQPGQVAPSYFEHNMSVAPQSNYATQTVPLNDAPIVFPERTSSLATNRIGSFDFGFTNTPGHDSWVAGSFDEPLIADYSASQLCGQDPFVEAQHRNAPAVEHHHHHHQQDPYSAGLGISCESMIYPNFATTANCAAPPMTTYIPVQPAPAPVATYPEALQHPDGLPTTPHRHAFRDASRSPSPPMTEPRSRRASTSRTRRASKHQRAKSLTGTPRHSQSLEKGGFVNFTPHDSSRILSGVAPSGSSKTKARREKEAADKRRRLSQAAVKAVVDAGGDIESLAKAGLIV